MKIKLFNAPKASLYCWFELAAGTVIAGVGFAYTFGF